MTPHLDLWLAVLVLVTILAFFWALWLSGRDG